MTRPLTPAERSTLARTLDPHDADPALPRPRAEVCTETGFLVIDPEAHARFLQTMQAPHPLAPVDPTGGPGRQLDGGCPGPG